MSDSQEVASGYVSLYARMESAQVAGEIGRVLSGALSGSEVSTALSSFSSFSTKAGAALTGGLMLAIHGAKDTIGEFLETISTTQSADLALTTMFTPEFEGDREAAAAMADEYIGWLNDFAIKTPFGFESALAGARTLIAMGYEGEEVLDENGEGVLRWSGDMAAALGGNAQTFNNIILQLGHMKSLGHVMSYQMNALARNGVPAWKALAEYMNAAGIEIEDFEDFTGAWDVEAVRAATKEGAISSDIGIAALEWYSENNYADMMEQESHTFRGVMMNMADAVETPIRTLYEYGSYQGLTDALYNMLDPLREFTTALLPTFALAFKRATPAIEWATDKLGDFTDALNSGAVTPQQIISTLEAIGMALATGPLAMAAGAVSGMLADVARSTETFSAWFGDILAGAAGKAESAFKTSVGAIGEKVAGLSQVVEQHVPGIGAKFSAMGETVKAKAQPVGQVLMNIGAWSLSTAASVESFGLSVFASFSKATIAGSAIIGVVAAVGAAAAGAFVAMGGNMARLGEEVERVLTDTGKTVSQVMQGLLVAFDTIIATDQMASFFNSVSAGLNSFLDQVGGMAPQLMRSFGVVLDQVVDGIIGLLVEFGPVVLAGAIQLFTGLVDGLASIVERLTAAMPALLGGVMGAIVDNLPALIAAGVRLFAGLVDAFATVAPIVISQLPVLVSALSSSLATNAPVIFRAAETLFMTIADAVPAVITIAADALVSLVSFLAESIDASDDGEFASQAVDLIGQIGHAIGKAAPVALAAIGGLLASLVGKLPEFIQDFLAGGASFIANLVSGFTGGESVTIRSVSSVILNAVNALGGLVGGWVDKGKEFLGGLKDGAYEKGKEFAGWVKSLPGTLLGLLGDLGTFLLDKGREFIGGLKDGAYEKGNELSNWVRSIPSTLLGLLGDLGTFLLDKGREFIGGFLTGGKDKRDGDLSNFFKTLPGKLLGFLKSVGELGKLLIDVGKEFLGGFLTGVGNRRDGDLSNFFKTLPGKLLALLGDLRTFLLEKGKEFLGGFKDGAGQLGAQIGTFINDLPGTLLNILSSVVGFGSMLLDKGKEFLKGFLTGGENEREGDLGDFFKTLPDKLLGFLRSVGDLTKILVDAAEDFIDGFMDGLTGGKWSEIIDWAENLPQTILDSIGDLGNTLWQAGADLVGGLQRGIEAFKNDPLGTLGGMLDGLINGTDDALDSHSPSKVFEKRGEWIVQGLDNGIGGQDGVVDSTLLGIANGLPDNFADAYWSMHDMGAGLVTSFGTGGVNAWNKDVSGQFAGIAGILPGYFGYYTLWDAGQSVMRGFGNSMVDYFNNVVTSQLTQITNAVPNWKGPLSRDRSLLVENGKAIMGGLTVGLKSGAGDVRRMLAGFTGEIADMAGSVNEEFAPKPFATLFEFDGTAGSAGYNGPTAGQMAEAFASQLSKVGVYLSANETSAQLAPSMDRALGRLSYMGV